MKKVIQILFFFVLAFLFSDCKTVKEPKTNAPKVDFSSVLEDKTFPEPRANKEVSDFELVFSLDEKVSLIETIRKFEKETSNQIAIVSIKTINGYDSFQRYAIDLSNYWGVGQKDKDNGLTIIFSTALKKIRISTGVGTEKILTDEICKSVIENTILPEFKKENYYTGIELGLDELIQKWKE